METLSLRKRQVKSWCILGGLLVFFLGMLAVYGVGVYNDSEQYITMHIHREPLYPLFLALFRALFGGEYLTVAAAVQNILTAVSIWVLAEYITSHFGLRLWEELLVVLLQLVPHLMTRYVSALHIFLENSVMSEALCIPLFQFFLYFLLRMLFEGKKRDIVFSLIAAFLLSLTRGQMMTTILMWMVLLILKNILQTRTERACYENLSLKRDKGVSTIAEDIGDASSGRFSRYSGVAGVLLPIFVVAIVFGLRSLTVHVYNYAVTGYFMGNTYGQVNTLTNVIYACDREDGQVFEEGSLEREFFERFYEEADALGANYKYGGDTFTERAEHLEESHDALKFQVLEADLSAYYFGLGKVDYYQQSRMSDEMAGRMLRKLLPECFGQWFYDYILLCTYGFIRSVAVVHPVINWIALLFYVTAAGLAVWQVKTCASGSCVRFSGNVCAGDDRGHKYDAAVAMGVALLFIAANVCAASMTIMCLSRYMVYGFSFFYTAFFLLVRERFSLHPEEIMIE